MAPCLQPAGMTDYKREPVEMTGKGIKALKRTGAENRSFIGTDKKPVLENAGWLRLRDF